MRIKIFSRLEGGALWWKNTQEVKEEIRSVEKKNSLRNLISYLDRGPIVEGEIDKALYKVRDNIKRSRENYND